MYSISKGIWDTFIVCTKSRYYTMCCSDTIFTYLQDRFPMTHYIFVIGDNDSGKTAFIDVMGQQHVIDRILLCRCQTLCFTESWVLKTRGQAVILLMSKHLSEKILETLKSGYKKIGFVGKSRRYYR